MSNIAEKSGGAGPSHRRVEIAVALIIGLFGVISIYGSWRVGISWGAEGPRAGFFPFYVGLFVVVASALNLASILPTQPDNKIFAEWPQLRQVGAVVVPATIYVLIIPYIGIYVSSALMIAVFMKWFGKYPWHKVVPIAVAVPIALYFTFEKWFLVPLPKGPLEQMLHW
jgi:putative tricarboxylic transport membrane protein